MKLNRNVFVFVCFWGKKETNKQQQQQKGNEKSIGRGREGFILIYHRSVKMPKL